VFLFLHTLHVDNWMHSWQRERTKLNKWWNMHELPIMHELGCYCILAERPTHILFLTLMNHEHGSIGCSKF